MNKKVLSYIDNLNSLKNKKVVITGANSGIGFLTMKFAVLKGAKVIMACRSLERAKKAREEVLKEYKNASIEIEIYDQSKKSSVRNFANVLKHKHNDFDVLFLNAGILKPKNTLYSEDDYPLTLATNFYGALLLVDQIEGFLNTSKKERKVIFEGSIVAGYYKYKNKTKDLIASNSRTMKSYYISKIGVENLFVETSEKIKNPKVKIYLAEPGICQTKIYKTFPKWMNFLADHLMDVVFNTPEKASLTALSLIADDYPSNTVLIPKNSFGIKGFPKETHVRKKTLKSYDIIKDTREILYDNE